MASSLTVRIEGDTAFIARLDKTPISVFANVKREVTSQTLQLERLVKQKLSGEVLNVRSGRLRRSIFEKVDSNTDRVTGIVASSADVPYGKINEYGGTVHIPEITPVKAKSLFFSIGGASVFAMRVKAHDVTIPERSFMRSSFRERAPAIEAGIQNALAQGVKSP